MRVETNHDITIVWQECGDDIQNACSRLVRQPPQTSFVLRKHDICCNEAEEWLEVLCIGMQIAPEDLLCTCIKLLMSYFSNQIPPLCSCHILCDPHWMCKLASILRELWNEITGSADQKTLAPSLKLWCFWRFWMCTEILSSRYQGL